MRRDVRPDQLARIGKCRKFCGGDDLDQCATYWLEEKFSQHGKKLKSKPQDIPGFAVGGGFGLLVSERSGVRMLDMATDSIVLAGIQPDANAVKTTVDLDTFDALGPK
jgi:hypothetical protein